MLVQSPLYLSVILNLSYNSSHASIPVGLFHYIPPPLNLQGNKGKLADQWWEPSEDGNTSVKIIVCLKKDEYIVTHAYMFQQNTRWKIYQLKWSLIHIWTLYFNSYIVSLGEKYKTECKGKTAVHYDELSALLGPNGFANHDFSVLLLYLAMFTITLSAICCAVRFCP